MIDYFSLESPNMLVLRVINISEINKNRKDLIPDSFPIQLSIRSLEEGLNIRAHKHLPKNKLSENPVEAWMIFSGSICATIFENNGTKICSVNLNSMDLAIFYTGGHALQVMQGPANMLEIKTGPYEGVENDKIFID
jgi:hypothetical protein